MVRAGGVFTSLCDLVLRLLLPFECHKKGLLVNVLPQHLPKHFHYAGIGKEDEGGPRSAKRKLLSLPLHKVAVSYRHY